ncbi:MAG: DUF3990 domain-containing protein [Mogibacterium sp.]|nr:DUF3990 domain-containing protein [Mogibacterium sp.]
MIKRIYHGSPRIVKSPKFGTGRPFNDFGFGYYCTEDPALAREWAVARGSDGFVNRYTIETDGLRVLNLNSPEYCVLHWLAVLLDNREFDASSSADYQAREYLRATFATGIQGFDCIIGYRADDVNFTFAQDFLNGRITVRQLRDALRASGLGRQFVLKSNRAFDRILFDGYETVRHPEVFPAGAARELKALRVYERAVSAQSTVPAEDDLRITQILSEEVKPYDPRLR